MTMPELTGIKLAQEILTFRADVPVILGTGVRVHEISEQTPSGRLEER
jgi:FixJ family two-component response regulator